MRRVLVALTVPALLLTACGGGADEEPTAEPQAQTPSPEPEPEVAPLTGEPVEDERVLDRPVVAVKIDNAVQARPQEGLEQADVIFEEVVEGGSTRFLALFHSAAPDSAGPVRSGRDVEALLLPPYRPLFVISGAADPTYEVLRGAGLKIREEGQPEEAFRRAGDRKRPYNLFVDVARMYDVATSDGLPAAGETWSFDEDLSRGEAATGVRMSFSPIMPVRWTWDETDARWLREQAGGPHRNAAGERLGVENVVVMKVPVVAGGGVDAAGNLTQEITVTGSGEALILRDGKAITGLWRKESATSHIEFVTADGVVLPLAPGRTWVEMLPNTVPVTIDRPAPPATATATTPAG